MLTALYLKLLGAREGAKSNNDMSTFDPKHNDPYAKVILVSSDHVSFRAHAWYMAKKRYVAILLLDALADNSSAFIKGLLDVPSNQSLDDAPIQLNQTAEYVRKLLDFVYATGPIPIDTARECHALLEVYDHLQMSEIRITLWKMVQARLNLVTPDPHAFGLSPWEAFRLGASLDSPILCYDAALAFCRYKYTVDAVCCQAPDCYQDMPSRYLATLLTDIYYQRDGTFVQRDMHAVAGRFAKMISGR